MLNYRKDLEKAARQMILIHRVDTLIKLILRTIINPSIAHVVLKLLQSQELTVKHGDIPFNFCVIDETFALIELSDPFTNSFHGGFTFESHSMCQKLVKTFNSLYQKAEEDPLVAILKKRAVPSSTIK